jgi:hypothetical protein
VGSHDVVGLFLLAELVAVVLDSVSVVSRTREEVTSEPCMAENRLPPNTPATPSMWKGCIRMLCSAWNTSMKLKVPDAQGHAVGEGTLTEGVDQEHGEAAATGAL